MNLPESINNKHIRFIVFDTATKWFESFPDSNWALVVITEEKNRQHFDEIIRKAIDRNVGYIHAIGKQQAFFHDLADEVIVYRQVENEYLPEHLIMTTGEENFEDGMMFGIYLTSNLETEIKTVTILDMTRNARPIVLELLTRYEANELSE